MHLIKLRYVLLLLLWLPVTAFGQLRKVALTRQAPDKTFAARAKQKADAPLLLPFWDDFSFASGHPQDSLWVTNKTVFVNDGQAINPPSLNVATFDGYNENGIPYSTVSEETGYRDTLESQPINLNVVPAMYRNSIYLSFFYQAGGNSEIPDPGDFLKLEFKSTTGWQEIYRFKVKSNADPAVFYDTAIQIQQAVPGSIPEYFHDNFQFRFTSFGKTSGAYDGWHLDYVYLNRRVNDNEEFIPPQLNMNEGDKNTNISDRTITRPSTSIFANGYYAMPYVHFLQDVPNSLQNPVLQLFSLIDAGFPQVSNYLLYLTVTSYIEDVPTIIFDDFQQTNGFVAALPSRQYSLRPIEKVSSSYFGAPADSVKIFAKIGINSGDMDTGRDYFSRYDDVNFFWNDTVTHTYTLSNYYAYDDGAAEYAMTLATQGNQFAYRFVMDNDVDQDTLSGIKIYFPYAAGSVPPTVQVFVFQDKAGKPDSAFVFRQTMPVVRTANNAFTEIKFTQGILVKDTFYIGYLETITGGPERIRIGLDASHDTGDQMYVRNTVYHEWVQNDELTGSAMIRPVFGKAQVITGVEDELHSVSLYPNPNSGAFYLKGQVDNLQILSFTGQSINFTWEAIDDLKKVNLQGAAPGLYIVRYRSGSKVYTRKILVKE